MNNDGQIVDSHFELNKYCVCIRMVLLFYYVNPKLQIIFRGINREKCEKMLEKMRYIHIVLECNVYFDCNKIAFKDALFFTDL